MLEIRERDFEAFFMAAFNAYPPESPYVSPMKSDLRRFLTSGVNPLFTSDEQFTFFTAHRSGRPVGRITAHIHDASNRKFGLKLGYFGFFDCADDPIAASLLLEAAERWANQKGLDQIAGNFNLTAMQQIGVTTDGFEQVPYTDFVYSPPWIAAFLEANGYGREFPMTTFETDIARLDPAMLLGGRQQALLSNPDFTFAPITSKTLMHRLEDARAVLNASFIDNPMFVAQTQEEFAFQAKEMKWIMDPRISSVVHHKGKPAGAVIAIPDLNPFLRSIGSKLGWTTPWHFVRHRMNRTRAVIIFQGVAPEFQSIGLNPLMLYKVVAAMKAAGYRTVGGTWIADENAASLRQTEKAGARPLHRQHLFRKTLS